MSMTENEVKETKEWLQDFIRTFGCNFDDLETRGFNECVMFLKELEQYRAIGTVEEIKSEHKELIKLSRRYLKDTNELIKYQEIGTIEEFKQAMNFKKYFMELYGEGLEVANWHKNGDLEPLVNFIDEACN
jgi:hypothetical protein